MEVETQVRIKGRKKERLWLWERIAAAHPAEGKERARHGRHKLPTLPGNSHSCKTQECGKVFALLLISQRWRGEEAVREARQGGAEIILIKKCS